MVTDRKCNDEAVTGVLVVQVAVRRYTEIMDTKLIAITTASDEMEATMIVGLFAAAGIPAMAKRSVRDGYGTVYQGPFGSFDILVDEENATAAQTVLDAEDVPGELDEKPDIPAD
jgi:hypothetical protein